MKLWKKIASIGIIATLAAANLAACGSAGGSTAQTTAAAKTEEKKESAPAQTSESGEYNLVIGHLNAETHTWHKMSEKFKEEVEAATDGRVTVTIYPGSQLGSETDMNMSAITGDGSCDIVYTGESMQTYESALGIIGMPYAITSDEHMDAVLNGEAGKDLEQLMEKTGLHVLGAIKRGPRNVTSKIEIKSPDDMKGFKIRTPESAMTMAAFEAMGAKPTPMAFSEIFTSLQQGVIDGQENPLANIKDGAFYEVQDYVIKTEHLRAWVYFAISAARFNSFPEDIQKAIQESADKAIAYEHDLFLEQEKELQAELESKGMTFVEVDQKPFRDAAVEGVLGVLDDQQKAIYEKIVAADPANK